MHAWFLSQSFWHTIFYISMALTGAGLVYGLVRYDANRKAGRDTRASVTYAICIMMGLAVLFLSCFMFIRQVGIEP